MHQIQMAGNGEPPKPKTTPKKPPKK